MKSLVKSTPTSVAASLARAKSAVEQAFRSAKVAVEEAIMAGHALLELKNEVGHGQFEQVAAEHFAQISDRTLRRWMEVAERSLQAAGVVIDIPVTRLLTAPQSELSEKDQEARQLYLDFTEGKTLKELRDVVVGGEDAHCITRAHNGRTKGGTKGEDRKDWPKFIGEKLSDITAHLKHWESMTPAQQETVLSKFNTGTKWPTPVLDYLKTMATKELKTR